ncbi:MAG: alpha/beta fold hydrolase [Beijerinckiaceae bacterium]
MSGQGVKETFVDTPSGKVRIWEKGRGKRIGFFAGIGGLPKWLPFLDRLAETHRVLVPALPGFPGGASSEPIDERLDWVLAAGDAFDAAGLDGADLIGASVGGALACEVAAMWPGAVRRLVLISPYGFFDESNPVADVFAQPPNGMARILSEKPDELAAHMAMPEGGDPGEWEVMQLRANVAAANIIWPLGDTRVAKRLGRIEAPALLLWGDKDRVIPGDYAEFFKKGIAGKAKVQKIKNAGHRAEFDQPAACAKAVTAFLQG